MAILFTDQVDDESVEIRKYSINGLKDRPEMFLLFLKTSQNVKLSSVRQGFENILENPLFNVFLGQ